MENWIETINPTLFNYIRTPFWLLVTVFAVIVVVTAVFVVREIKHDRA